MYLESLELQGFKSFPDKIKLEFDKGLTAVVGPNGSGKSNISDAVRWVLGEQSSKTLRGAKMEDVIFSGTVLRKPVGFASVTLNIVNSKGILQLSSEQVSVTRKLYRSGDSEYLINGAQVRLKDINELFMDTGLGRDGYSVIGQGRISEIISAKSGERREIFEEAAGISKFRYKKAEAERRLNHAEDNLLRLRDILSELEGRVGPLKAQSEKAALFIDYSEKKKILEISVWVCVLNEHKNQLKELSEKILISENDYNAAEAEIARLEDGINKVYQDIQDKTLLIERLREKILEAERGNTALHSDIAVFENDILHSRAAIEEIEKQRELSKNSSRENLDIIEKKLFEAKKADDEVAAITEEYGAASERLERLLSEQSDFDSDLAEANNSLNRLYIRRSELTTAIASSENAVADMNEELSGADGRDEGFRAQMEALRRERAETDDALSIVGEKISEYSNRLAGMQKLYEGRNEKLELSKKEQEALSFKINDKNQRIRMLQDLERSMEGVSGATRQVLKAAERGQIKGVRGSVARLITVEGRFSVAIEVALGAAMHNVVVDNDDAAKRCIELLKETKAGRATFLPLTNIKGNRLQDKGLEDNTGFIALAVDIVSYSPEYTDIFTSILGRTVIAEDLNTAGAIAKKYGYRFKIVTLDGQVINAGGSFTGGSVSKSAGILTRKNEIERLGGERAELEEKLASSVLACEKLKTEADKLYFDMEGVKENTALAHDDQIRFESEIKRIEAIICQTGTQLDDAEASRARLKARLAELYSNAESAALELKTCQAQIHEKENLASENEERRTAAQDKRGELSSLMSELKLREMEVTKDRAALLKEAEDLRLQCEQIGDNTVRLAAQREEQEANILEKERLIEERKQGLADSDGKVKEINERILSEQLNARELERGSNEQRVKIRELSDMKEKHSRETSRLEERKISVTQSCDEIIADMSEQYNIYQSEAADLAQPVSDLNASKRELDGMKRKIRELGNVNLAAIEEYKEVSERYHFLSEQLADVEASKRELERLINELTDDMRRMFTESFTLINENFKSVFTELFGGGSAELSLSDPEDVLESGIEIRVAPPGKVINNLSLLSGGEQAFAAIAIYFSILKIKPAPFCILDEIEAALDDINVIKYARYLRRFTDTTQFILVTHRRGTMEEADIMYGVTMQDKGISKVLKMEQPTPPVTDLV
ncbi:MAG: chromosome segregation protein SMC [Oscillospiraceae bacterium]|nr:chromosome segregation protein SMC [Oscillospiraceae bacterium]